MFRRRQPPFGPLPRKKKLANPLKKNGVAVVTKGKTRKAKTRKAQQEEKEDMEAREVRNKASPHQRAKKQ